MKTQDTTPYISIITVVYNGEKHLKECIDSVANQTYREYEHIIIDGQSSDNTLQIIENHQDEIAYWISERDSGIYDAMNKGIQASRGQWLYFLGCDDKLFSSTTLESVVTQLTDERNKLVYGNVATDSGTIIQSKYNAKLLLHNTLHHQSCFYKRDLYDNFSYDNSLKLISDYELNLICYLKKIPSLRLDATIARCRDGGASTTPKNHPIFLKETNDVRSRHLGKYLGSALRVAFLLKAKTHYALRHL